MADAKGRIPIILDTDIGDDIDDALALALILKSPEFDLRGVTTVFRNAPRRALLAQRVLSEFGRGGVPVAPGASKPLLEPFDPRLGSQFEILDKDVFDPGAQLPPHAVDFLASLVEDERFADDEEIVIAPIGPLTNIALAIACEPELVSRTRLVLMGGFWKGEYAEWNIKCDPEAAAMVFNSGIAIDMVGLDVTLKCQLSPENIERVRHAHPLLGELMSCWTHETGSPITLHDPLALLSLVSDAVRFEDKRVEVGLCAQERGKTLLREGEPNCRAAVEVDAERAVTEFLSRLGA
jgi:purine nucleosidase